MMGGEKGRDIQNDYKQDKPKKDVVMLLVSAAKYLINEKRFLLVVVTGLFLVFTLFTAPLFSMIAFTQGGGELIQQQVVDSDPYYYFLRQASASEGGEQVTQEEPTGEVVDETPPPIEEPPPPTEEPPPIEEPPPPQPPEPDVQEVVPEEGETAAAPLITPPTTGVEPLTASFSIDSTNGDTAPATFLFEADVQGGTSPYTYSWNFGDGSPQGSGISIHHTYQQAGTYDVTLAVTDSTAPTPQDISVSRQVTVRPATTTTDEIALPSTNATTPPTLLMNETNQTILFSTTGPSGLPTCIMIDNKQYCLQPPNTPIGEGCVSLRLSDGTEAVYCIRNVSYVDPYSSFKRELCRSLGYFGSFIGTCTRQQPSPPRGTSLTGGLPPVEVDPGWYSLTLKSIRCEITEDLRTDDIVIKLHGDGGEVKTWSAQMRAGNNFGIYDMSVQFNPGSSATIALIEEDLGHWPDPDDLLGALVVSSEGSHSHVYTGHGARYEVFWEVVKEEN